MVFSVAVVGYNKISMWIFIVQAFYDSLNQFLYLYW
jgi:hypothetical protein